MPKSPSTARLLASAVLIKDGKALIIREQDDDGRTKINLPGGHVEPGEGVLEAVVRETLEETGLIVTVDKLIQVVTSSWKDGTHSVKQAFLGRIEGGDLKAEEGCELVWISEEEVATMTNDDFVFGVKEGLLLAFKKRHIDPKNIIIREKGEVKTMGSE